MAASNDVVLLAGNDITITTSQDTLKQESFRQESRSGFMTSGLSIGVGRESMTDAVQTSIITNNGSTIGSVDGNVTLLADGDISVLGSQLIAGQDLTVAGRTIEIDAAVDTYQSKEQQTYQFTGLMVGVTSPLISVAQTKRWPHLFGQVVRIY